MWWGILRYAKNVTPLLFSSCGRFRELSKNCAQSFHLTRKTFARSVISYPNGSRVLLAGILTFLGLEKEAEEESELIMTIKRGILSIQRGEPNKAEKLLHAALEIAQDKKDEEGITYVYDVLANLAFDRDQNTKAEKLFVTVMQRLVANGASHNDNRLIHISLKLARIYERTKDYEKAELGYKYCIDHLREKVEVGSKDQENENKDENTLKLWITTLDNYARFLSNQHRTREALDNFKKAYATSLEVNGKEHEDTALLLNDLGTIYNVLGDLDSAVVHIEEAVNIGQNLEEMENMSVIYINLGRLYLEKEMYNQSKLACLQGLRHARKDENAENIKKGKDCLQDIEKLLKMSEM